MKKFVLLFLIVAISVGISAWADDSSITWDCTCGAKDNIGNFCPFCGSASPVWICPACGTTNNFNYCTNCGQEKPAGTALKLNENTDLYDSMTTEYADENYEEAYKYACIILEDSAYDAPDKEVYYVMSKIHVGDFDKEDEKQNWYFYNVLNENIDVADAKEVMTAYKELGLCYLMGTWFSGEGSMIVGTNGGIVSYDNNGLNGNISYMGWGPSRRDGNMHGFVNYIEVIDKDNCILYKNQQILRDDGIINYTNEYNFKKQ